MMMDAARALAQALRNSPEYRTYAAARDAAMEAPGTRALYREYKRLQMAAQADAVAGRKEEKTLARFQAVGELLQFDEEASAFLLAEYRLNALLSEVYGLLAQAVELDLSMLEG